METSLRQNVNAKHNLRGNGMKNGNERPPHSLSKQLPLVVLFTETTCCLAGQVEAILFNTASWETVTFHKLALGKPEGESVKYDLCGKCAPMVKVYCFGAEAKVDTEQEK